MKNKPVQAKNKQSEKAAAKVLTTTELLKIEQLDSDETYKAPVYTMPDPTYNTPIIPHTSKEPVNKVTVILIIAAIALIISVFTCNYSVDEAAPTAVETTMEEVVE